MELTRVLTVGASSYSRCQSAERVVMTQEVYCVALRYGEIHHLSQGSTL